MLRKKIPTVRLNSHVRADQKMFIVRMGKKEKKSHGQVCREIIDFYINNKK